MKNDIGKNRTVLILTVLLVTICSAGSVMAQGGFAAIDFRPGYTESLLQAPRSAALAGSDMAVAAGPFATLTNAAPLPAGNWAAVGYGSFEYLSEIDFTYLGAAVERGAWRLGAVSGIQDYTARTAYDPVGTDGETDFLLLSASYDLTQRLLQRYPDLDWTVGLGYRYHSFDLGDDSVDGWDLDLGTSARWTREVPQGRLEVCGSFLLRNVADQTLSYNTDEGSLPRFRNFGLAVALVEDLDKFAAEEVRLQLMCSTVKDQISDNGGFLGDDLYGAELTLLEVASLRVGYDGERILEDELSWGLGLRLPTALTGPFVLGYDFADLDDGGTSYIPGSGERNLHSFFVRYRF